MESTKGKPSRYQLKKQAVFDALYKCCEINGKEQISLTSVLQYISKEIDSKFKNSELIVSDLKQKLSDKSQGGWLSFAEACDVFGNWMDKISCKPQSDASKTCRAIEYTSKKLKLQHTLSSSQPVEKSDINGGVHEDNIICEILFSKCENCGRTENCCEWRSNETSREEGITRSFEQKVMELQNLLRQSEDCNSIIHLENESLRQNYAVLQSKELRWIEKEEELQEHEQQITCAHTLLKEQNVTAEKEIRCLKQHLNRLRSENEKILSQNFLLEERVVKVSRMEKLLSEARQQHTQMQMDIESKDAFLAEVEMKLKNIQEYNEILEKQIKEMENCRLPDSNCQTHHERSIGEELMVTNVNNEISFESNDIALDVLSESSLKAELDACWGQWPLSCEQVAVQATPSISTSATQTDEYLVGHKEKSNNLMCPNKLYRNWQSVPSWSVERISAAAEISEEFSPLHLNDLLGSAPIQQNMIESFPLQSETESCLYVPHVPTNVQTETTRQFCSKFEMEIFTIIDAMTQTESLGEEEINNQIPVKASNECKIVPKRECSSVNTSALMIFVDKSCSDLHCTATVRNRISDPSSSSAIVTKNMLSMVGVIKQYQRENISKNYECSAMLLLHNSRLELPIFAHHPLDTDTSVQLLRMREYGVLTRTIRSFCYKKTLNFGRSVCWNTTMNTVTKQARQTGLYRYQSRLIQVLIVIMSWYLFQALIQPHDGFMKSNLPFFWMELHKVLSQKMELHWPNGPPPQ